MSEVCPDIYGRDCDGGSLPKEARRVDVPAMPEAGAGQPGRVHGVRDDDARTLSDRALALIDGDRQAAHGPPERNLAAIGRVWGALLDRDPIEPWLVALMMTGLKLTRAAHSPLDDDLVDGTGYLELARRLR